MAESFRLNVKGREGQVLVKREAGVCRKRAELSKMGVEMGSGER